MILISVGQPKSLSILFDFSLSGNAQVSRSDYTVPEIHGSCEPNEIYNPFEEKCVVLSCAEGMIFIDDECRPLKAEKNLNTCETSSLIVDYITSDNTTSGIQCLEETLDIHDLDFTNMNVSQCNGGNCFHMNLQILDVNSSLPEDLNKLFYRSFLEKDLLGSLCNISSIDVVHLCRNVPRDTCNSTINEGKVASSLKSISGSYDIDWRYGFWYDTDRQIYITSSNVRTCNSNVNTNLKCPFVIYPSNEFREHSNKADHIVHNVSGNIYGPAEFENLNNGSILVCPDLNPTPEAVNSTNPGSANMQSMLTVVGTVLSLVALFLTFMCYCYFRTLRTLPGKSVMNLVIALFFSMFIFIVGSAQTQHVTLCTIVAVLLHFFWLASFFWMNVLAFDVRRTFNYNCNLPNAHRNRRTLIVYGLYAWGSPAIIVGTCLAIIGLYSPVEIGVYYGNSEVCFLGNNTVNLIAFGGPVGLTLSWNAIFFILTVSSIRKTKQVTKAVQKNKTKTKSRLTELLIYIKLSTLMGMSWILGFVATITNSVVIWYIFIVLNSLQGVFVFIFFVCNHRVYKLIRKGNGEPSSKTRSTDAKPGRPDYSDVKKMSTTSK
ncbi:adhesion G protein-coupled receptor L4-like [Anneissia japonica]|uniref:adhesion G protein-coupled receptor L4-like n=1 Tax=Anneissia japonica TaxID=1529436 RepID=UPI0014258EEA|nr:adhesion G protein-coupled receptor L4-like [Anneissia japonica]